VTAITSYLRGLYPRSEALVAVTRDAAHGRRPPVRCRASGGPTAWRWPGGRRAWPMFRLACWPGRTCSARWSRRVRTGGPGRYAAGLITTRSSARPYRGERSGWTLISSTPTRARSGRYRVPVSRRWGDGEHGRRARTSLAA